ncbi:TraR/DksA family transcriptional regulator [Nonomuraea harbinensis]|uniref:TraR/DksA family transcriptional regulator n=1 Tax=Nonomuraea harbinensis TaxID=1286938 RepID=A0ABW1BYB3_9ACTN|nr:TraR/DksA C4-type zinc finger protein [Nonomuraea harbinensis]
MASLQTLMQDYDQHRARLEELRDLLEERLAAARADLSAAVTAGSAALAGLARRESDAIESALARMDRGLYGTCVRCGAFIPYGVLRRIPHEQLCLACAGTREQQGPSGATEIPAPRPAPAGVPERSRPEAAVPPGPGAGDEAGNGT